jgi:plasmid maintenance system antidote protein VapI
MKYGARRKDAFKTVVLALLDAKRISQRELAIELDTSPSNLNQRILAGSMRPDMILRFNDYLDVDLLNMVSKFEKGESIPLILKEELDPLKHYKRRESISSHELKELLENQANEIKLLTKQVQTLTAQINILLEKDTAPKSRRK